MAHVVEVGARRDDAVPVAEIAEAAEVSKRTLFAYFPTKDDLVLHRFADHEDEPARVVRDRTPDETPLDALRRHLRKALEERNPITGLCDTPAIVAFHRLVLAWRAARPEEARTDVAEVAEHAATGRLRTAAGSSSAGCCSPPE